MTDLCIVGAGPVGLVTALYARRAGHSVTVLERRDPAADRSGFGALDKACGEGLMAPGLAVLSELGVAPDPQGSSRILGIRYLDGDRVAEGRFIDGYGMGIRRLHLHKALIERAEQAGVDLRFGVRAEGIEGVGEQLRTGGVTARWVVGADGLMSRVRRWADLDRGPSRRYRRFGIRRHFAVPPWTAFVEVYWHDTGEAYVTPVGPDQVGVAFLCNDRIEPFEAMLPRFPALAERLAGVHSSSRPMGTGPFFQRARAVTRGRVALVGDASGYMDAVTGEGLSLGFRQARALVDAITAGDLRRYARAHRRMGRIPNLMMGLLLETARRPWLRRRTVEALAREGPLWSKMLAVGHGAAPITLVKPWELMRLGSRILAARGTRSNAGVFEG